MKQHFLENEKVTRMIRLIGARYTVRILENFGGCMLYLPMPNSIDKVLKEREIFDEAKDLPMCSARFGRIAREHKVSINEVKNIVRRWKKGHLREKFTELFENVANF